MSKKRVIIMGAAGRDFHNFNTCFRDDENYDVVAFTATQIPDIEGRVYPPVLAGGLYPQGIPIYDEADLTELIITHNVDLVVFAYSDVPHEYVMNKASQVISAGADFQLMGPGKTMIESKVPIVAVCAVRTGCGKSQTTRKVLKVLEDAGLKSVAVRHPMPYGDLSRQIVQRFADYQDLKKHECTIEEIEEYEPHIASGRVVYAGVDYEKILREAEKEADVVVWDGGNNDISFYKPQLYITVADPLRPGHELTYFPGEVNTRMADVIVINKVDSAKPEDVETLVENIKKINSDAIIIKADSSVTVDQPQLIQGKRVLCIEDGPTLTHGGMNYGAGTVAAKRLGALEIVDPSPYAVGTIKETYDKYPNAKGILPAMGYSKQQLADLQETIEKTPCDLIIVGTPIDLRRYVEFSKPAVRVIYELEEIGEPNISTVIEDIVQRARKKIGV